MRALIVILCSAVVGATLGVGLTWARYGDSSSATALQAVSGREPSVASTPITPGKTARVLVDSEEHDFGAIENDSVVTHGFRFTNNGQGSLTLTAGGTTCQKCTIAEISQNTLAPGESVNVNVQYTAGESTPRFRQSATILTNDPDRPRVELSVSGSITAILELYPRQLVFSKLSVHEPHTLTATLLSHISDNLNIVSHQWSDPSTEEFVDVQYAPLDAVELEKAGAKSGQLISVTVKPGLPLGPFRQRLKLVTDLPNNRAVEFEVLATISSDLSVVGSGWNDAESYLMLGTVSGKTGAKRNLLVLVRGPHRDKVQLKVHQTEPDFLKVTIGEASSINEGAVVKIPVTIEIPPGSPSANHLGTKLGKLGRITLESTHPDAKQLKIPVRFAVEE